MFKKISKFILEVKEELKNVSWPSKQELKDATIIVLVSTSILTFIIWIIDLIYTSLINKLL